MLPWLLLRRAVREADVRREVEPLVGFTTSLLLGRAACSGPALLHRARLSAVRLAGRPQLLVPVGPVHHVPSGCS